MNYAAAMPRWMLCGLAHEDTAFLYTSFPGSSLGTRVPEALLPVFLRYRDCRQEIISDRWLLQETSLRLRMLSRRVRYSLSAIIDSTVT